MALSKATLARVADNGWHLLADVNNANIADTALAQCPNGHTNRKTISSFMVSKACRECRKYLTINTVYVAKYNESTVKIGIAKQDRVAQRLKEISRNFSACIHHTFESAEIARNMEKALLSRFPVSTTHGCVEGRNEFRQATIEEVRAVMEKLITVQQFKALKEKHALSAAELARLLYVTEGAVHKWLSGDRKISRAYWELLQYKLEGVEPPKPVWANPMQGALL